MNEDEGKWARRFKAVAFYFFMFVCVALSIDSSNDQATRIVSAIYAVALGAWWYRK